MVIKYYKNHHLMVNLKKVKQLLAATSGATSTVLVEDLSSGKLYISHKINLKMKL